MSECIRNCSFPNGSCNSGICYCNAYYFTDDCSMYFTNILGVGTYLYAYIFGVIIFVLFVISMLGLVFSFRTFQKGTTGGFWNLVNLGLISIGLSEFGRVLWMWSENAFIEPGAPGDTEQAVLSLEWCFGSVCLMWAYSFVVLLWISDKKDITQMLVNLNRLKIYIIILIISATAILVPLLLLRTFLPTGRATLILLFNAFLAVFVVIFVIMYFFFGAKILREANAIARALQIDNIQPVALIMLARKTKLLMMGNVCALAVVITTVAWQIVDAPSHNAWLAFTFQSLFRVEEIIGVSCLLMVVHPLAGKVGLRNFLLVLWFGKFDTNQDSTTDQGSSGPRSLTSLEQSQNTQLQSSSSQEIELATDKT